MWAYEATGATWSSPAVVDGVVYIGNVDYMGLADPASRVTGSLLALDEKTGAEKWRVTTKPVRDIGGVFSSPLVADGLVYFGGLDGFVYAVKVDHP